MTRDERIAVLAGGAVGTLLRWIVAQVVDVDTVPLATLVVNLLGTYLLARLVGFARSLPPVQRVFLTTGVLGSFTTFSAVAVELVALGDRPVMVLAYGLASMIGGLALARLGLQQSDASLLAGMR